MSSAAGPPDCTHTTQQEYASRLNTYNAARSTFQAPNTHTQPGVVVINTLTDYKPRIVRTHTHRHDLGHPTPNSVPKKTGRSIKAAGLYKNDHKIEKWYKNDPSRRGLDKNDPSGTKNRVPRAPARYDGPSVMSTC